MVADNKSGSKIVVNVARNRLNVRISGNVCTKSLEELYTEIRFCVGDLKPGFDVIEDSSQCNLLYVASLSIYKKIIDYLITQKVGRVIRIISDESLFRKQFTSFASKVQCYRTMYAQNIEEAKKILEKSDRRNGIRFKLFGPVIEYSSPPESGKGFLIDISTSGCAVESPTIYPAIDTEILFTLTFEPHNTLLSIFRIHAKIIRIDDDMFAAQFLYLDDENKERLYQRLSYEVRRTKYTR